MIVQVEETVFKISFLSSFKGISVITLPEDADLTSLTQLTQLRI